MEYNPVIVIIVAIAGFLALVTIILLWLSSLKEVVKPATNLRAKFIKHITNKE